LLGCFLVVGLSANIISISMKIRVNDRRPHDQKLSWWSRDFREVNRAYRECYPESVLPDVDRYGGYSYGLSLL
jgi:hypothetical protein